MKCPHCDKKIKSLLLYPETRYRMNFETGRTDEDSNGEAYMNEYKDNIECGECHEPLKAEDLPEEILEKIPFEM